MTDTIEQLHKLWEDAAMTALDNSRRASGTEQQKNTTNEGGVKQQARELQRKDPTKLKEADLVKLLEYSKNKLLADGSYIPVRINTPQILIAFAKEQGYTLDNHPIAMRVYKARQAMANVAEWDGNFKDTPHNLTPKEIVEIIRAMDNPTYLVFQSRNERFSEIVKFNKGKEKAYAIIDFFDVNKNAEIMNGYKGGKYNILVTVYPADDADNLKAYLKNKENKVITSEEIKKKGLSQRGLGSYVPAHLNDSPFFNDSIPQTSRNSQEKNSLRDPAFVSEHKQKQLEIIQQTNPMWDDYHTGIRTVADIHTWAEVLELNDEREGQFVWGDFSRADAEQALKDGTITVYSSHPIKNGVFVSTSYIQAQEYAGGRNGKVYSKTIPLTDVAWINGDEGQYAEIDVSNENELSRSAPGDNIKYSVRENFYTEFDQWVADGRKDTNIRFVVGTTSEALKSIGMKDQEIILRSGTVNQKLNKHTELTTDIFRNIPDLLENPVIVQFSDAKDPKTNKPKFDSRITLLGELYADVLENGKKIKKPVLVSLELLPTNQKNSSVLDFSIITSAYAKNALQHYLQENSILYIDPNKKRTNKWLSLNRLQLPLGETKYGSIRKITYSGDKVKIQKSNNKTAMEAALEKAGVVDEFGNAKNSLRDPEAVKQYEQINRQLEKENRKLREDVSDLKELVKLQRTLTHGKMFTKSQKLTFAFDSCNTNYIQTT